MLKIKQLSFLTTPTPKENGFKTQKCKKNKFRPKKMRLFLLFKIKVCKFAIAKI
jgi:hypothetical protein